MDTTIKDKIDNIIKNKLGKELDDEYPFDGKNMFRDLNFDSVTIIELISLIEEEFKVDIPAEELIDSMSEYDKIITCVMNCVNVD